MDSNSSKPDPREVRSAEDFDILIGFFGFCALILFVVTLFLEVTGKVSGGHRQAGPVPSHDSANGGAGNVGSDLAAQAPATQDGQASTLKHISNRLQRPRGWV